MELSVFVLAGIEVAIAFAANVAIVLILTRRGIGTAPVSKPRMPTKPSEPVAVEQPKPKVLHTLNGPRMPL